MSAKRKWKFISGKLSAGYPPDGIAVLGGKKRRERMRRNLRCWAWGDK